MTSHFTLEMLIQMEIMDTRLTSPAWTRLLSVAYLQLRPDVLSAPTQHFQSYTDLILSPVSHIFPISKDGNSFLSRTPDQKPPLTRIFNSYLSFIHHIWFIRKFCCLFKIYSKSNHFSSLRYYHLSLSHHHTYPLGHHKIPLGPLSPPLPLPLYSLSSTQQPD